VTNLNASANSADVTDWTLNNHVAHKITSLWECGASDIEGENKKWLTLFMRNSMFYDIENQRRAFAFNYLRRVEGAFESYSSARMDLIKYLSSSRTTVSPYFDSLRNYELYFAQAYQGFELLARQQGKQVFMPGNMGKLERLQKLYVDSKHMDQMIDGNRIPEEATSAIWITNNGLESKRAKLTFDELVELDGYKLVSNRPST